MIEIVKNSIQKITSLCEELKVEKLWIFGSAIKSSFSAESDVDFLVSFSTMKPEDYAENYFLLAENLEEILGRDVDLVTVNSLSNPYFIQSVEESKTLIYDRQNQKFLVDILESAESIEKYIENIDFFQYQKNKMIRRAVEREL